MSDYNIPHDQTFTLSCLQPRHVPSDGILVASGLLEYCVSFIDLHLPAILRPRSFGSILDEGS